MPRKVLLATSNNYPQYKLYRDAKSPVMYFRIWKSGVGIYADHGDDITVRTYEMCNDHEEARGIWNRMINSGYNKVA